MQRVLPCFTLGVNGITVTIAIHANRELKEKYPHGILR